MYTNNEEQVLRLRDLLAAALHNWRRVLVMAIVLALLLGAGVGALTALKARNGDLQAEAEQEYRRELEAYEAKLAFLREDIQRLRSYTAQQQLYLKESVLMNVDPYSSYTASWNLYVADSRQGAELLLLAYQTELASSDALQAVAQQVNIPAKYLKELFGLAMNTDRDGKPNLYLTVRVRCGSAEDALRILDAMQGLIPQLTEELTQTLGAHTVTHSFTGAVCVVDMDLATVQRAEANRLTQYETSLQAQQKALEELKRPKSGVVTMQDAGAMALFFLVLGFLLGIPVGIAWQCVRAAGGKRVLSAVELEANLGLPVLGTVASARKKSGADRLVGRLMGLQMENTGEDKALLSVVLEHCGKTGDDMLIAGQGAEAVQAAVACLEGRTVHFANSLLEEASAVQTIKHADGVVIAVRRGQTQYASLQRQLRYLADREKPVYGFLMEEY